MRLFKNLFNKKEDIQIEEPISPAKEVSKQGNLGGTKINDTNDHFTMLRDDGVRAMRTGQLQYAEHCFTAALKLQDDEVSKSYLAEIYMNLNIGEKALPILNELAEHHPDEIKLFLAKAQAAHQCSDWNAMNTAADQILRIDPKNSNGFFNKALALFGLKNYIQSIVLLTQILTDKPDATQARMLRAKVLFEMQQYSEAEKDIDLIINEKQANEDVFALKGDICRALGHIEAAILNYNEMKEMNPFNQEFVLKVGKIYVENHQLDKALSLYDEAIELQPNFAQAYKERGGVRFQLHDELGATDDLKKALELAPEEGHQLDGNYENVQNEMENRYKAQNSFGF
ncbi:MAG: tetratricopeptide repeat protein [Bacteroidaceae bacterium]|jgi:tetratricopeptide (TPR) repeat protein|nr:tetratricopeptide repeat protein [Bacteroidaceae bacterium]